MKKLAVLCTICLWPAAALAQEESPAPAPPAAAAEAPKAPEAAPEVKKEKWKPMAEGSWSLGLDTMFNYTSATNDLPDNAGEANNSTLFLRMTPSLGYFIIDNLELSLAGGILVRQLQREGDDTSPESNLLLEFTARYFTPPYKGFAMFVGAGVGGYFGSSERSIPVGDGSGQVVNESTDTLGFSATGSLGASYIFRDNLQLRAGLAVSGLIGQETIPSLKEDLGVSTFNAGLNVGVYYVF